MVEGAGVVQPAVQSEDGAATRVSPGPPRYPPPGSGYGNFTRRTGDPPHPLPHRPPPGPARPPAQHHPTGLPYRPQSYQATIYTLSFDKMEFPIKKNSLQVLSSVQLPSSLYYELVCYTVRNNQHYEVRSAVAA